MKEYLRKFSRHLTCFLTMRRFAKWSCALFILFSINGLAQQNRKCLSHDLFEKRAKSNPELRKKQNEIDAHARIWKTNHSQQKRSSGRNVVTIPVVFHVIWNDPVENVSDNQIFSQLDVLNEDFNLENADSLDPSHPFYPLVGNAQIEFCLATVDPQGNSTSGITRTQTSVTSWAETAFDDIKSSANGGRDNWDPLEYLNIYIANLEGTTLGFASFPADLSSFPENDGVVIRYEAFGNTGTAGSGIFDVNDLGRTATHEVGHWLNLLHIWGDTTCGDDQVDDTEPAEMSNAGCPTFPHNDFNTCGSGPDGEMYMNYMDYVDDNCMNMFTEDQCVRMEAALFGARSSILNSQGCGTSGFRKLNNHSVMGLAPNPGNEFFTVSLKNVNAPTGRIIISDYCGRMVYTQSLMTQNEVRIDSRNWATGMYQVRYMDAENNLNMKLSIIR